MWNVERYLKHSMYNISGYMRAISIKNTKVYGTTDKKKLSTGEETKYEYGTVSIRDQKLSVYIGRKVRVRVELLSEKGKD
jgi:hypothetical protein